MNKEYVTVLVVDDEPDIVDFIAYNLRKEGWKVLEADNGKEAIKISKEKHPNLILLDVMMPEMDGMEACREIRSIPDLQDTLIAFLTARNEDYSQISGFESGADDYISKPIKPKLLISRIKALLRRQNINIQSQQVLEVNGIKIDKDQYLIIKDGKEILLPKKEFELLYLLATKPGRVFKRAEILQKVWGQDVIVGDRTIDVHIRKLREKIGDKSIKTMKGIGYKLDL